ncbi:MAG: phosphoribosylamine--glycine ligase [Clostridiales bacterium]|jgi:phosphoribosylamine--glycine ligase|nr:phosphoribosylamine--glycine ligase [Clostridiales bacterium]
MNILLIGNGGREHAIADKIASSPKCTTLYITKGNYGTNKIAIPIDISPTDVPAIVDFAKSNAIDFVIVAPDDPLALGLVDMLTAAGIRAFGPTRLAAKIEWSKVYSKNLMKKYNIPTATYETFDSADDAIEYLKTQTFPIVIKAEGLALGKGVIIAQNFEEANIAIKDIMLDKAFGEAGNRVVIEEFLSGREITVLAFTDGTTLKLMPSSQDHKRALDNDQGLNTGGMGAYSPSPIFTPALKAKAMDEIFTPTLNALNSEGIKFKGVLYFGLILTDNGLKVIEYNSRFGDPETQVILPQLQTDLLEIFEAIVDEKLDSIDIKWNNSPTMCVVMASGGYPKKYQTGKEIFGIDDATANNNKVYISGALEQNGKPVTSGGRVLCVVGQGETLADAATHAYSGVKKISFEDMHYRTDIGKSNE